MLKRLLIVSLCLLTLNVCIFAQTKKSDAKRMPAAPAIDKAYLQKYWDAWSSMNTDNAAVYYASGPHTFYDIAPLKYGSWEEYQKGVKSLLANYKSASFTLNDDTDIHPHGDLTWITSTVKEQMTTTGGKVEMGSFRWTAIFENQSGKWLIVHEHVSEPLQ
jgi:ketosteroid isomerase-like protein